MTNEEAKKVAGILVQADGICADCAYALTSQFLDWQPQFLEEVKQAWKSHFGTKYEKY